jgi:tetratricopeptide (TPR) repeat protein
MNRVRTVVVAALLLGVPMLAAQSPSRRAGTGVQRGGAEINVRVTYENGRPAAAMLRVELINPASVTVTEGATDNYGVARVLGVTSGNFRLRITGMGIEEYTGPGFYVDPLDSVNMQMVTVRRTAEAIAAERGGASVSAAELNIPDKARRQFEKGERLMTGNNPGEAIKYFNRASDMYPQYAAAFDATGIALTRTSPGEAKGYFQKAIDADKQYAPGYRHLAKAYMGEKQYPDAERLLTQAATLEPRSVETLFLLAYTQQKQQKHDAAIESASRAHSLPHPDYATVHLVAGESYTRLGRLAEAVTEYNQYLREAPLGPSVDVAKKNISVLQAQMAAK